jgi:hypothetical protein
MISTLCMATDAELDNYTVQTDNLSVEDNYATIPMVAIRPLYQQTDEEELYTSFEEAISDRLVALRGRLSRLSDPALSAQGLQYDMNPCLSPQSKDLSAYATIPLPAVTNDKPRPVLLGTSWQHIVILASLALMCILIGFDLMGLLVLHMR